MRTELLAEPFHVRIERAAVHLVAVAPDGAEKIVAILLFAGALAEKQQELELGGGEINRFVVQIEPDGVLIETERAELVFHRAGGGASVRLSIALTRSTNSLGLKGLVR